MHDVSHTAPAPLTDAQREWLATAEGLGDRLAELYLSCPFCSDEHGPCGWCVRLDAAADAVQAVVDVLGAGLVRPAKPGITTVWVTVPQTVPDAPHVGGGGSWGTVPLTRLHLNHGAGCRPPPLSPHTEVRDE